MNNFEFIDAVLQLSFEAGVSADGKAIVKTKAYRNVKAQQSATTLMAVANAIASLTTYPLAAVKKTEANGVVTA